MKLVRWLSVAGLCAVLIGALQGKAYAHPHVWIDSLIQFDMKKGKIVSITLQWRFDELFSSLLKTNFDKDKDGKFSKEEIADMKKRAFSNLANFSYFTQVRVDGKVNKIQAVKGFSAKLTKDDRVIYSFRLVLPKPVDPRKQQANFRFLDESYYVDVRLPTEGGIRLKGKGAAGCTHKIQKDTENPIYNGLVVPDMVRVNCAGS